MLTCHFTIGNEKQSRMSFSDVQIIRKEKYLPLLSTVNLPLVEFVHILTHFDKSAYKFGTLYKLTVEKKPLVLVRPYLGSISLQTRTLQ